MNLKDMDKAVLTHPDIKTEMAAVTKELGEEGRILLRPSGTEPLIRVMVEALDEAVLDAAMLRLVAALKTVSG